MKLIALTKNVKWRRSPSRFISAAKSVSSCQRSSSVQLSNAMTTNCGGRSTPARAGVSAGAISNPNTGTSFRAITSAPRPIATAGRKSNGAEGAIASTAAKIADVWQRKHRRLTMALRSHTRTPAPSSRGRSAPWRTGPMQKRRPVMLAILDGWGWRDDPADNAVRQARTPHFNRLWDTCPHALLHTSGKDVGLPPGQMGNSEVGHLNIGAGRLVLQDLPRINEAIADGEIERSPALTGLIARLRESGGTCHLLGLVSPGGVHSHQDHAAALASLLAKAAVPAVVHAFTDGRDTPPRSAGEDIARLLAALPRSVAVATVCGRYYAMDRDKRWDRVAKAYRAIADAEGPRFPDAPAVVGDFHGIRDGDGLLCFNFRADRVREILAALLDPAFAGFPRRRLVRFAAAAGMTAYSDELDRFLQTIFPPQILANVLGQVVADAGRAQLRMAETEKYPHVTYFLNGGREEPYRGEDRIIVPSPKIATYDLQPEM